MDFSVAPDETERIASSFAAGKYFVLQFWRRMIRMQLGNMQIHFINAVCNENQFKGYFLHHLRRKSFDDDYIYLDMFLNKNNIIA